MQSSKTIIILGGGVGGLITANLLSKKIPNNHKIILVDREPNHLFSPSLLWLMTDDRKSINISRPLARLEKKGIEIIQGEITQIDKDTREIEVNGEKYKADYLVISLGAELVPEIVPGLSEGGYNFYTLEGAEQFRDDWKKFRSGKLVIITSTPAYKCPAAPYEAAMLLQHDCHKRKLSGDIEVVLYTAEAGPMGVTGAENSNAVKQMVEEKGVVYYPEHIIEKVDPSSQTLLFSNGTEVKYDLLCYVPPHKAPEIINSSGLLDSSGWVPVDRHTLETTSEGVYAIGDITGIPLKVGPLLPMAGVFAHNHAKVVAHNIAVKITGQGNPIQYTGYGECFIEIGGGKAGLGKGNFYAEPVPLIKMYKPRRFWHWGKIWFEKRWLRQWF